MMQCTLALEALCRRKQLYNIMYTVQTMDNIMYNCTTKNGFCTSKLMYMDTLCIIMINTISGAAGCIFLIEDEKFKTSNPLCQEQYNICGQIDHCVISVG